MIRLFGREFTGMKLTDDEELVPTSNTQLALRQEIEALKKKLAELAPAKPESEPAAPAHETDQAARLARIYGFTYLGNYYKLPSPAVLRVFGPGFPVKPGFDPENSLDLLGVEFKDEDFVAGIHMWPVDHLDAAVRIDITVGWYREVLLDADMANDVTGGGRSDTVGRDSGLVGRDSGLVGRDSGLVGRDSGFVGRPRR